MVIEEYKDGEINKEEFEEIIGNLKDLSDRFKFSRKDINSELQDYIINKEC
jgi:hypothetical protein